MKWGKISISVIFLPKIRIVVDQDGVGEEAFLHTICILNFNGISREISVRFSGGKMNTKCRPKCGFHTWVLLASTHPKIPWFVVLGFPCFYEWLTKGEEVSGNPWQ